MRQAPDQTPPLLYGPDEVAEGYRELDATERRYTEHAFGEHRAEADLWRRALTLYRRGMLGTWEYPGDERGVSLEVWGLRMQLLGLGVSSAKAGIDMLLAGYYSVAYASIRHMLETFIQCWYVEVVPADVRLWYEQPGGPTPDPKTPGTGHMVATIKRHLSEDDHKARLDGVYESWDFMSKGSHPTGQGIVQTLTAKDGRYDYGATYRREMALAGFDVGLYALTLLLRVLSELRPQGAAWPGMLDTWRADVVAWREAAAAELVDADEGAGRAENE